MKLTITRHSLFWLTAAALLFFWVPPAQAVRIKDIATFSGVRDNQLIGYGLVVGLAGTGDKKDSVFTLSSMKNMMDRMGVGVNSSALKIKNVASVMVTARMPVSSKPGSRLDVTVSSVGDATSLLGGVLLQTALKGVDGKTYCLAQGALTVGGFSVSGAAASTQKNVNTVGLIPGGGIVERAIPFEFNQQDKLTLNMRVGDFSTADCRAAQRGHGRPLCPRRGRHEREHGCAPAVQKQSRASDGFGGKSGSDPGYRRQGGGG